MIRKQIHSPQITCYDLRRRQRQILIAAGLQARIYFAHPYSSWERGLNENTNGLVRQYLPKKYAFSRISDSDLQRVEDLLNNRPRKTLGYRTPNEVFFKQRSVALPS
jgi:IS30 family transposase